MPKPARERRCNQDFKRLIRHCHRSCELTRDGSHVAGWKLKICFNVGPLVDDREYKVCRHILRIVNETEFPRRRRPNLMRMRTGMSMRIAEASSDTNMRRVQDTYQQMMSMTDEMGNPDLERQIRLAKEAFVWMSEMDTDTLTSSSFALFYRVSPSLTFKLVEVKKSAIAGGGWGLFSCRNFAVDEVITLYLGTVLEDHTVQSIYSISNGLIVLDCKPWLKGDPYLGGHLANDPNWEGEGVGNFANGGICKQHNAEIGSRFELIATKSISKGNEILLHCDLTITY